MYDLKEITKLEMYLMKNNIPHEREFHCGGVIINVYEHEGDKERAWDAIINDLSYGRNDGLLEICGVIVNEEEIGDRVEGWLTAEDVIARYEKHYKKTKSTKMYVVRTECDDPYYCEFINMGASFSKEAAEAEAKRLENLDGWAEVVEYDITDKDYCKFEY